MPFPANNLTSNGGELLFAGYSVCALAKKYGTPLYLMDETRIRENMRKYTESFRSLFGTNALPLYASKACSFKRIYEIAREEGMGVDVVSSGEIATAVRAGFPMERSCFHSNNKTDADIRYAMEQGVGTFVADNQDEVDAIERIAGELGRVQKVMLRLTPGIDPHTYEAVSTGKVDSKFGTAIETGQAEELLRYCIRLPHIHVSGFHCHVGSQVFGEDVYLRTAECMFGFFAEMKEKLGFVTERFDIGGGYGVRYTEQDSVLDIPEKLRELAAYMKRLAADKQIPLPFFSMEPGRSIVADAGLTVYTVGSVKRITGYKNYVSIDGGMTDNPRYALYGSRYTVLAAGKLAEKAEMTCDVVGRCCESGDIIQPAVRLPESICRGDILAVCTTGAYNYSMASHYNRLPKPPIVMLGKEKDYVAVRRETVEDLIALDI